MLSSPKGTIENIPLITVDFSPSLIQTILLIFLSYLNDKTTITYLYLQNTSTSSTFTTFMLFFSLLLILVFYLLIGKALHIIIQPSLLDWLSIFFFFISSIYYICESYYTKDNQTFDDELVTLINSPNQVNVNNERNFNISGNNINNLEYKKPLTTITELKGEDSKCTEDNLNLPLLKSSVHNYSLESDEKEDNNEENHFLYDFFEELKQILSDKYNDYGNFAVLGMCAVYDYNAVVIGSVISLIMIMVLCLMWGEDAGRNIKSKKMSVIYGIVLVVYAIQLYFYKVFKI